MNKKYHIIPYLLDEYLLLSLSKDWIYLFDRVPEFEITIGNDRKLHLVSKQEIKQSGAIVNE